MTTILSIFYAEFEIVAGPCLRLQSPPGFMTSDDFDCIADYVISKDLAFCVTAVEHPHISSLRAPATIISFPVSLHADKYARNNLLFSVGFVLAAGEDTTPFQPVLRKLGTHLAAMEAESEFLFRAASKAALGGILASVLAGLTARGECFVAVDGVDTVALKLLPSLPAPPTVRDHDVPVRLRDLDLLMGGSDEGTGWDLCLRMVVPHIDGVAFVRAIAETSDVELDLVREAMAHLLAYGLIRMVDVFQYSNVYATDPRVQLLLRNAALREACVAYVTSPDLLTSPNGGTVRKQPQPLFHYLFRVLTAFGAGSRAGDVFGPMDTLGHGVLDHKLATFAVMHGLLRRIFKYAVPTQGGSPSACASAARTIAAVLRRPPLRSTSSVALSAMAQQQPPSSPETHAAANRSLSVYSGTAPSSDVVTALSSSGVQRPAAQQADQHQLQQQQHQRQQDPQVPLLDDDEFDAMNSDWDVSDVVALMDGTHHLEEICCRLGRSQAHVEEAIAACHDAFVYVLK